MSGETNKMTNENGNIYRKVFGDKLALLRMKNHLKQQDIADKLGIPVSTYRNYEIGLREAPYSIIVKLADILGVSLDYLFGRSSKGNVLDDAVMNHPLLSDEEKAMICAYVDLPPHSRLALMSLASEAISKYESNLSYIRERSEKRPQHEVTQKVGETKILVPTDSSLNERSRKNLLIYQKSKEGRSRRYSVEFLSDNKEADKNEDA